jgi:hypothetical protein
VETLIVQHQPYIFKDSSSIKDWCQCFGNILRTRSKSIGSLVKNLQLICMFNTFEMWYVWYGNIMLKSVV